MNSFGRRNLNSLRRLYYTVTQAFEMRYNAFQRIAQPNTALYDCKLYLQFNTYDPSISPGSTKQCVSGKVYLRSILSTKSHTRNTIQACICIIVLHQNRHKTSRLLHMKALDTPKAATASSACWHHHITMGGQCTALCGPEVRASSTSNYLVVVACSHLCLLCSRCSILHTSVCCVLICTVCAAYLA